MTIPVWVLLAFAGWTVLTLVASVGAYRISKLVTGKAKPVDFPADDVRGSDFYRRAMRAHANCVENLPVYGAVVVAIVAAGVTSATLDALALVLIGARVVHTGIHLGWSQTNTVVLLRFGAFLIQLGCMVWMGIETARLAS